MKLKLLSLALASFLTACGGGGVGPDGKPIQPGDIAETNVVSYAGLMTSAYNADFMPRLAAGDFTGDGSKFVVISGIYLTDSQTGTTIPDAPVKLYRVNSNGTGTDVTEQILGVNPTASGKPLVADFNGDGIDDLFVAGIRDFPVGYGPSVVYLSRRGQTHRRVDLPDPVWSHQATVADLDNNGTLDVVNSAGQIWINDGRGNFTFKNHSWTTSPYWMNGSGVCTGDLNNNGTRQIVMTDLMIDGIKGPISDTVVFELDSSLNPIAKHTLPSPLYDRTSIVEQGHDVACTVGDLNNDGLPDIVVSSRPWDSPNSEGAVQILINRGNFQFEDVTDVSMATYSRNVAVSYQPLIMDLNNDGKNDLWLGEGDPSMKQNQAWINDGTGKFTKQSLGGIIDAFFATGPAIPIKFDTRWAFLYTKTDGRTIRIFVTTPTFKL